MLMRKRLATADKNISSVVRSDHGSRGGGYGPPEVAMGRKRLELLISTMGEPRLCGLRAAVLQAAALRSCYAVRAPAWAIGICLVALTILCGGVASGTMAKTDGSRTEVDRNGMSATDDPVANGNYESAAESSVSHSELPMLPGADRGTREDDRELHTQLAGLGRRSDPTLRYEQGLLWLNHTDQGAQGVGMSVLPLSQNAKRLTIDGVYIDHAVGTQAASHNRAWSLALNSRWLSERLTLHAEYAQSRKNRMAWGALPERKSDQAYTLLADYTDQSRLLGSSPLSWGLTVSWQQAGGAFWSPTAGDVSRDRATARIATDVHWKDFDARLGFAQATNNVADDPGVPTLRMNEMTADLRYAPRQALGFLSLGGLFAAPNYTLNLKHERTGLAQASQPNGVDMADRYTDTASLSARFTPGPWWWEVSYTHSRQAVLGQHNNANLEKNLTQLNLYLPLDGYGWLDLTPMLRWSFAESRGSSEFRTMTGMLGGSASLIPERLAAKLHFRAYRRCSSREPVRDETVALESSLDWTLRQPRGNQPNVTLSLSGSYRYADSAASSASGQYQAFSGIQVTWPNAD